MKKHLTKLFFLSIGIIFCNAALKAQSTFKKTFHESGEFKNAIKTSDKAFVAFGSGPQPGLIKIDSLGNTIWSLGLKSTDKYIYIQKVVETTDGNFFTLMSVSVNQYSHILLATVSKTGSFISAKRFFHSSTNTAWDLESDGAGGVLVVGGGCNGNNSIIRCDKNINVIWQKGYSISSNATATSIIRNSKGNFVIGGYAGLSASTKQVLFEIDVTGKVKWSKCFTGFTMANIENIVELADGGYGLIGYGKIIDPQGGTDIVITRTDKTGKMIWSRILNKGWEAGNDLVQLNDGSLLFCGVTDYRNGNSDALLGKISLSGQVQLLKYFQSEQYNGSPYDVFHTIVPVCDNKFAVFGLVDGMVMTFVNKNAQGVCNGTIIPENQLTVKDTLYAEEPYTVSEVALSFHDTIYSFTGIPNYTSLLVPNCNNLMVA